MIRLKNKETGDILGSISEEELQFLIDHLEEEFEEDTDYYLNRVTIEALADQGANRALMDILEHALGDKDDVEVVWVREEFIFSPTGLGKKVVFGHTPFPRPFIKADKIGIDTGAVYGGRLTAVELPGETFVQSFA